MKYNYHQKRDDYLTPPELVEKALKILSIRKFELDTCCSIDNIPADSHYYKGETDGLKEEWADINWCNPPYNQSEKWVEKAYIEQQKGKETMMLIPVRTETRYWHNYILFNPDVCIYWLRKGYEFLNPDNNEKCGVFKNALALVLFKGVEQ